LAKVYNTVKPVPSVFTANICGIPRKRPGDR
jgi:hypothetical protein